MRIVPPGASAGKRASLLARAVACGNGRGGGDLRLSSS